MPRRAGALLGALLMALGLAAPARAAMTPPNLSQPVCGSNYCDLQWTNPVECVANCTPQTALRQWVIERAEDSKFLNGFAVVFYTFAGQTFYRNTGLTPGTTYYYRIRAYPYSNYVSGTPNP